MRLKKEYPWLSYSDCSTFYTCKRKFKWQILDGESGGMTFDWVLRGSEFHHMFNQFYDTVDLDKVIELAGRLKILDDPAETELFDYFYELVGSFIDHELFENDRYVHLLDINAYGFSVFQVMCIIEIMREFGHINKKLLRQYWFPRGREEFLKDEENMLYGTVDTWYEATDGTYFVLDYKTGRKKYQKKTDDDVLKKPRINWPANMQGWFYTWLIHVNKEIPLKGMKFILLYTKGNPLAVDLKITKASIQGRLNKTTGELEGGLLNKVAEIRKYVKENTSFPMVEPDSQVYVCPYCQFQNRCHNDDMLLRFGKIRKEEWAE